MTLSLSLGLPCVPVGCYKFKETFSCIKISKIKQCQAYSNQFTVILVTDEMRIIAIINCGGTKCLTELIKWDAVLQVCNED